MSEEYEAGLYAAVHDGNVGDVEFYRRACAGGQAVLELGCGDGRVLGALVEDGRVVVGVDLDRDLLALARGRLAGVEGVELVEGDMADPGLLVGRRFDRVVLPHGGLYCLLDDDALERMVANVRRWLVPGGRLILDAWAADEFHREAEPEDQAEGWLERVKTVTLEGEDWEVLERSRWDKAAQRLDVTYLHVRVGEEEAVEGLLRQRYVTSEQLQARLSAAGFVRVELAGGFAGEAWDDEAELLVVIAEAPVE